MELKIEELEKRIEALEQEPSGDLISRDAVIYYIKGHIHEIITESGEDKNAHTNRVLRALINGVETMPPVNPQEPKTDVLDEIKAEIKQLPYQRIFGKVSNYSLIDVVIEIIDKYRESEDKR
jgi:hypothetical protein